MNIPHDSNQAVSTLIVREFCLREFDSLPQNALVISHNSSRKHYLNCGKSGHVSKDYLAFNGVMIKNRNLHNAL